MNALWQMLLVRYWSVRSSQERRAMTIATIILLPILSYLLLWQPAHVAVKKLQSSVPNMRAQAAQLEKRSAEVDALRHRSQPASLDSGNIKIYIEESAQRQLIRNAINSLTVQDNNTVHITIDSIAFAQWLQWIHEMQLEQHIRAESVSISALQQPGLVAVSATLTNGAGQ
jgi:general secretion pathway protein M